MATTANRDTFAPRAREESGVLSRPLVLNWYLIAFTAVFALAVFTRFYDLGSRAMSHDESLHTYYSYVLYTTGDWKHNPMTHGPILFHATAFFYSLFGDSDFSARIYTSLLGVFMVMSPLLFRRWLGKWGTLLAAVMILCSPLLMYYNRYIREDTPSIAAFIVTFWAIMMYLNGPENQRRRAHWLYLIAASMIWNLGSKETAFFYVAFTGLFLMLYWIARMAQRAYNVPARVWFNGSIIAMLVASVGALGMYIVLDITPLEQVALAYGLDWFSQLADRGSFTDLLAWMALIFLLVAMFAVIVTAVLLVLYLAVRRLQVLLRLPETAVLPMFLVGTAALMLAYIAFDQSAYASMAALRTPENPLRAWEDAVKGRSFVSWSLFVTLVTGLFVMGTMIWGMTGKLARIPWRSLALTVVIIIVVLGGLIIFEEFSHVESVSGAQVVVPLDPTEGGEVASTGNFSWMPIVAAWVFGIGGIIFLLYTRNAGWWKWLRTFPELDILMLKGSLILPWLTAVFIYAARGTPEDFAAIANGLPQFLQTLIPTAPGAQTGQVVVGFLAWLPLMAGAVVAGLVWDWKRYIIASLVFHTLFAFFFTTVFTNIQGLATGMVYSLQYWLEQQGERRGSQPQYYYLLIVMPMYEFLPIIGSVLAMLAGLVTFWRRRTAFDEGHSAARSAGVSLSYVSALPADERLYRDAKTSVPTDSRVFEEDDALAPVAPGSRREQDPPPATTAAAATDLDAYAPQTRAEAVTLSPAEQNALRQHVLGLGALTQLPFLLFVSWWALMMLIFLTLAGEKMPWLGTHITLPMIFISAWYFGSIFDRIDYRTFMRRGWLYLLLVPLFLVGLFQVIMQPLGDQPPFAGMTQTQMQWTYSWLAALLICAGVVFGLIWLSRITGTRHLWQMVGVSVFAVLTLLTFRAAWMAAFINYDYATEFLVYAHATPGTKIVDDLMHDLSIRTTNGMDIVYAYDDKMSWPGVWYFRRYPNGRFMGRTPTLQQMDGAAIVMVGEANRSVVEPLLEDRYQRFQYSRMWWPMMDYFNLTAPRVVNTFTLAHTDPLDADRARRQTESAAKIRRGLFDIWWARDYTTYGQGTGGNFNVTSWPVSENMYVYVRRDFAAQVWPYGLGDGTAINPIAQAEVSACVANWQEIPATLAFDTSLLSLRSPIGIAVSNGLVFVAEDGNHRIHTFTTDGEFINSVGQFGDAGQQGAFFQRPHSIAVAPDGTRYVVDTWNYRIRKFNRGWDALASWGTPLTSGFNAETIPVDGFWGPRDAVLDAAGNVYVADTGNKRVRVYDPDGNWLRDIGSGGSGPGQLNEPAGLAISADGRLFVADTWNRRITVFTIDGAPLATYPVRAWYDEFGNRPYLAIDDARGLLYVTDPDAGRVLVLNTNGECVGAFGKLNRDNPNLTEFSIIGGVATDPSGAVYVVDMGSGRVLKFPPFTLLVDTVDEIGMEPQAAGQMADDPAPLELLGNQPVAPEVTAETEADDTAGQ